MLVADSKKNLERLVEEFGRVCLRRKLKVNVTKSKIMRSVIDGIVGKINIVMDDSVLEEFEAFKHLGSQVTCLFEVEVQQRVLEGSLVMGVVRCILKRRTMSWVVMRTL